MSLKRGEPRFEAVVTASWERDTMGDWIRVFSSHVGRIGHVYLEGVSFETLLQEAWETEEEFEERVAEYVDSLNDDS